MKLREHLQERPKDSPISIKSFSPTPTGGASLSLMAPPWGKRESELFTVDVSKLHEVSLLNRGGEIRCDELALETDHPLLLDYGARASIFGQAPLPDPYRFFLEFHKLVRDQFAIPREPLRYLNWQGRMSPWLALVYSRSYNLLTAPRAVCEGAGELLSAQVAEYIILDEPTKSAAPIDPANLAVLSSGEFWLVGEGFAVHE